MAATDLPEIPDSVVTALGALPGMLADAGYLITEVGATESFDNFAVAYVGPRGSIQIARDRGQFIVSGPTKEELESFGMWRTFAGVRDLEPLLKVWLGATNEA